MSTATRQVILHLGTGSFHRAHQAHYIQRLIEHSDDAWTLAAANIRDDMPETMAALRAQGGAYTLEMVAPEGERTYSLVRSIRRVVPFEPRHATIVEIASDPATRIISFTVTEAGYFLDADERLDLASPEIANDLQAVLRGAAVRTLYGVLTLALRARMARGNEPVTLLCCDNLRHNGTRSRSGLIQFLDAAHETVLAAWIRDHTTSPNSMVDRITPRPPPDLRARVREATGRDDGAAVMAESFAQWVIEEAFCGGRPRWEHVGVEMVGSVAPYEEAKIRLLNASHSAIAWAGSLLGHRFIHDGAAHAPVIRLTQDYTSDAIQCLQPSPMDLVGYRDDVLERFRNAALADTNQRVACDSYSKLQGYVVPTVRERLAHDSTLDGVANLPALYLAYLKRWHAGRLGWELEDAALSPQAAHALCESRDPVAALCGHTALWGDDAGDPRLINAVQAASARVESLR
jgi:D-arabinitol 4-dehydrogenase